MPFPPKMMDNVAPATAPMPGAMPAQPMMPGKPDFAAMKKHHPKKEHKRGENLHGRSPKERGK